MQAAHEGTDIPVSKEARARGQTLTPLCQIVHFISLSICPRRYLCMSTLLRKALWTSAVGVPVKPARAAVRALLNI